VDFALFVLVTAIQFIRPTDFVPGIESVPLYLIAIVPCTILSWHKLVPQLSMSSMRRDPVFVFAIGLLVVCVASGAVTARLQGAIDGGTEFAKNLIYYLLMVAHIDSPRRFKLIAACMVGIILVPVVLATLTYHGLITIPAFAELTEGGDVDPLTGIPAVVRRLRGAGNFADPNDVCEIVNLALMFTLYGMWDVSRGLARVIWLVPLAIFAHALALTHSRGGFLAAVAGLLVLVVGRVRGRKGLLLGAAMLLGMFTLFAGRQTSIDTSTGTGQSRVQLWDAGFQMLRARPILGVGLGEYIANAGQVAHNAFMNMYGELGFIGGTLFFGQYYWCFVNLAAMYRSNVTLSAPEMQRMRPFVTSSLAGFAAAEMSLTNGVHVVTYFMLGLAGAFVRVADPQPPSPERELNRRFLRRVLVFSCVLLAAFYVYIRLSVRY
jgi:hypothetical protein